MLRISIIPVHRVLQAIVASVAVVVVVVHDAYMWAPYHMPLACRASTCCPISKTPTMLAAKGRRSPRRGSAALHGRR